MNSLDKIKQYMSEGDFRKAIKELDLIISKEPNNAIAFYMRGKSAFIEIQNEKYDNSLEATKSLIYSTIEHDLNKSIEIDPNIIDAYRGLMYLNRVVRNVDKEREFAQILLEKSKETSIDALLILASSYLNNGKDESDFHQAIGFYDDFIKRVDIEDSKMARFERGLCYYNLDILNKADAEANKLIQDFPMYDDAYFLKGIALSKNSINSDFFEDAIFFLNRAVELNNKNYNALYEIAEWHFEKENYRKAIETYDKLLESKNKYNLASLLGKTQAFHDMIIESGEYKENEETNKDLDEAFNLIDKVIEILGDDIKSIQYKYYKGNLYSYKGEIDKAKEEFEKIWCHYFDLDRDYGEIKSFLLKEDEKLREAVEKMWGVRILNQEFFETLISFIISQNKQIPHIKQIVARISHDYGKYQGSVGGIDFYGFPTPQQLSQADIDALRECKTGFRAPYIYNAVEFVNNEIIKEENLRKCGVDECREQLMKIKGVGMKVANCVSLFGLGYREAFPVDVWIKRIMQSLYFDGEEHSNAEIESYGVEHFGKYGGYAQQYLFYYGKSEKIGLKNKTN